MKLTAWDLRKARLDGLQRLAASLGVSTSLPRLALERVLIEALKRDEIRARAEKRRAA